MLILILSINSGRNCSLGTSEYILTNVIDYYHAKKTFKIRSEINTFNLFPWKLQ